MTIIQLFSSYYVYYSAEYLTTLKANGELSVIALGLFINSYGKTKMYYESEKANGYINIFYHLKSIEF